MQEFFRYFRNVGDTLWRFFSPAARLYGSWLCRPCSIKASQKPNLGTFFGGSLPSYCSSLLKWLFGLLTPTRVLTHPHICYLISIHLYEWLDTALEECSARRKGHLTLGPVFSSQTQFAWEKNALYFCEESWEFSQFNRVWPDFDSVDFW